MNKKLRNTTTDFLFNAILKLESLEECYDFFEDVCTYVEINAMAQRLNAATLLNKGLTYEQVMNQTDISSATLSRVSKSIKYGEGYKNLFKKLSQEEKEE